MSQTKARIRFLKSGDLRFLSHHDLLRTFERMLRRAALPFRSTAGFHPLPKMAFASALALGVIGREEVVEIEFEGDIAADTIRERLSAQARPGLEILSVRIIDLRRSAQPVRAVYRVSFDPRAHPLLASRIAELLSRNECWVERMRPTKGSGRVAVPEPDAGDCERPQTTRSSCVPKRRVNIRPSLLALRLLDDGLEMEIALAPSGSARPEEVLHLLGLEQLLDEGAILERTRLVLADEEAAAAFQAPDHSRILVP